MYFLTLGVLCRKMRASRRHLFFFLLNTCFLILLTVDVSTNAVFGEIMFIENKEEPIISLSVWYQILGSASVLVMALLGDALLVSLEFCHPYSCTIYTFQLHRLWIIWGSRYYVILFPCLIYLAATGEFHVLLTIMGI